MKTHFQRPNREEMDIIWEQVTVAGGEGALKYLYHSVLSLAMHTIVIASPSLEHHTVHLPSAYQGRSLSGSPFRTI